MADRTKPENPQESIDSPKAAALIHIATIVIGLLIAVALEQGVERVHKHYELWNHASGGREVSCRGQCRAREARSGNRAMGGPVALRTLPEGILERIR